MGEKTKKVIKFLFPVFFFLLLGIVLFWPYFTKGLVPIPADILIGHYHPWKDEVWDGRIAGYPIKNFQLFDGILQTLPWRLLAIESFKAGNLPLWNPYIFGGMPLLANLQVAALYPLNYLFFVLPELDAWTIYVFLQPVLAGIFAYFFVRTFKVSQTGALLVGVCYGFSNIMMMHLENGIDGHSALWLPLALGAVNKIIDGSKSRFWHGVLTLSAVMTLLAGYPPPVIYTFIIFALYSLYKLYPFTVLTLSKTAGILISLVIAFLLTAPQLLPLAELALKVKRSESQFGPDSGEAYFIPWENLTTMIAPGFFGHPSTNNFHSNHYYTDIPNIGFIGLILVVYSLFVITKNREAKFWWIVTAIVFAFMLETPLGRSLKYLKIPVFSLVTPMKMIWVATFSLSVLAGLGFDFIIEALGKVTRRKFFSLIFPVWLSWQMVSILICFSFLSMPQTQIRIALRNLIIPSAALSIFTFIVVLTILFPKVKKAAYLIVLFLSLELLREGIKYNPFIKKELVYSPVSLFDRVADLKNWRSITLHPELFPVDANIPYRLPTINGYASIYDRRSGELAYLAGSSYPVEEISGFPRTVFQTQYQSQIIDLLGVKYVFSLEEIKDKKLRLVASLGKTNLYENLQVFPRAFLVDNYSVEKNDLDIINRMLKIDLRNEVVLEKGIEAQLERIGENASARIEKYAENEVIVKVNTSGNAILVLSENYYPGWEVEIDGRKAEIMRANYNLRAVVVPEGEHLVSFVYQPKLFTAGLTISFLSSFILLILFFARIIRTSFSFVKDVRRSRQTA